MEQSKKRKRFPSMKYDDFLERWFKNSVDIKSRTVFLSSETYNEEGDGVGVNSAMAEFFLKNLHVLNSYSTKPITVVMNNPGGSIVDGWAIFDGILRSPSPVDINVYGHAMSMGAVILQAGRERAISPNSYVMVHDGFMSMFSEAKSFESWGEWSKKDRERTYRIFAERTNKPLKYWREKFAKDYIIDAKGALKEGLVDRILPVSGWAKNSFNGKIYE